MNKKIRILALFVMVLLSINLVLGFGVVGNSKPTYIMPGETKEVNLFRMQNMVGDDDYEVRAEVVDGKEIVSIINGKDGIYIIKAGTEGTEVDFKITIPSDVEIGTEYQIKVSFTTTPLNEDKNAPVGIGSGILSSTKVIVGKEDTKPKPVVEEKEKPSKGLNILVWLISLSLLIVIVLIIRASIKKSQKKSETKL